MHLRYSRTAFSWSASSLSAVIGLVFLLFVGLTVEPQGNESLLPFGLSWETPLSDVASIIADHDQVFIVQADTTDSVRVIEWSGGLWHGEQIHEGRATGDTTNGRLSRIELVLVPASAADHVPLFRRVSKLLGRTLGDPRDGYTLDYWSREHSDIVLSQKAFMEELALVDEWDAARDSLYYATKNRLTDFSVTVEFNLHGPSR